MKLVQKAHRRTSWTSTEAGVSRGWRNSYCSRKRFAVRDHASAFANGSQYGINRRRMECSELR